MAATSGIESLTGCDPFIENDISYENGVQIFKKNIHEMTGEFDVIMLNDSFEHMTDPHETMDSLKRLLANGGTIKMTLPIYPNIAFEKYKENWYQLDAPRHIFLHSINSLKLLANQHGFKIVQMIFLLQQFRHFEELFVHQGDHILETGPERNIQIFHQKRNYRYRQENGRSK